MRIEETLFGENRWIETSGGRVQLVQTVEVTEIVEQNINFVISSWPGDQNPVSFAETDHREIMIS